MQTAKQLYSIALQRTNSPLFAGTTAKLPLHPRTSSTDDRSAKRRSETEIIMGHYLRGGEIVYSYYGGINWRRYFKTE